jgi:predicted MPP superfamily phosphohydrolase
MLLFAMKYNFISPLNHIVKENTVHIALPHSPFQNYKIAHISDLHLGYGLYEEFLERLIEQIIHTKPDICVITGDLITDDRPFALDTLLAPLKKLTKKIPTYFVVGNHELYLYRTKIDFFLNKLEELGIHTLHNQSTVVHAKRYTFNLVGVGDLAGESYGYPVDIHKSFSQIDPSLETIVLHHRPKLIRKFKEYPFVLALSGHHHGGQITKLGLFVKSFSQTEWHYLTGKMELEDGKFAYISTGIGYSRLPLRLFAPSELATIIING